MFQGRAGDLGRMRLNEPDCSLILLCRTGIARRSSLKYGLVFVGNVEVALIGVVGQRIDLDLDPVPRHSLSFSDKEFIPPNTRFLVSIPLFSFAFFSKYIFLVLLKSLNTAEKDILPYTAGIGIYMYVLHRCIQKLCHRSCHS